ncbi:MAG: hypothetical protein V1749_08125 [Candidatus Desantisbacteria bacterium]
MEIVNDTIFKKFIKEHFPEPDKWKECIREKIQPHRFALCGIMETVGGIINSGTVHFHRFSYDSFRARGHHLQNTTP